MTTYYRGISGSQYVYWDNVSAFMPVGTTNIMIMGTDTDSSSTPYTQVSLAKRVSQSFDYILPGGKLYNAYKFDFHNRNGAARYGVHSLTAASVFFDANMTAAYSDVLNSFGNANTNSITCFNVDGTTNNNWRYHNSSLGGSTTTFVAEIAVKYSFLGGGKWNGFLGNYVGTTNDFFATWNRGDNTNYFTSWVWVDPLTTSNKATCDVNGVTSPSLNTWYHLVYNCTYSLPGPTVTCSMYIDGILVGTASNIINPSYILSSSRPFYVGYNGVSSDTPFTKLAYFRTYNQSLTENEIATLYSNSFVGIMKLGL